MGVTVLWIGFASLALAWLSMATQLLDGAYEVVSGRPGFVGRNLRKRVPATELDVPRDGAAMLLSGLGLTFIIGPALIALISIAALEGGAIAPSPSAPDIKYALFGNAVFVAYMTSLIAGLACTIAAHVVMTKVNYTQTGATKPITR